MAQIVEINELLRHVDPADRMMCLKVFSVLKKELGEEQGFSLSLDFASRAHNYDLNWVKANYKWAKPILGIGYLRAIVRGAGWAAPARGVGWTAPAREQKKSALFGDASKRIDFARAVWTKASDDQDYVAQHPYTQRKEIGWAGGCARGSVTGSVVGKSADCLIVPVHSLVTDDLQGVQCINADGLKQSFGLFGGGAFVFGDKKALDQSWAIAEGWASTVALVKWLGYPCAVCSFGKSRMNEVFDLVAERFKPVQADLMCERDD